MQVPFSERARLLLASISGTVDIKKLLAPSTTAVVCHKLLLRFWSVVLGQKG